MIEWPCNSGEWRARRRFRSVAGLPIYRFVERCETGLAVVVVVSARRGVVAVRIRTNPYRSTSRTRVPPRFVGIGATRFPPRTRRGVHHCPLPEGLSRPPRNRRVPAAVVSHRFGLLQPWSPLFSFEEFEEEDEDEYSTSSSSFSFIGIAPLDRPVRGRHQLRRRRSSRGRNREARPRRRSPGRPGCAPSTP